METRLKVPWRSRVTLALAILSLGVAPAYAKKTPPANAPLAVVSPPGPLEVLLDVRSPNVANEVRLRFPPGSSAPGARCASKGAASS